MTRFLLCVIIGLSVVLVILGLRVKYLSNKAESYSSYVETRHDTITKIEHRDRIIYRKSVTTVESKPALRKILKHDTVFKIVREVEPISRRIESVSRYDIKLNYPGVKQFSITAIVHRVPRKKPRLIPRFLRKKDLVVTVVQSDTSVNITNIHTITVK